MGISDVLKSQPGKRLENIGEFSDMVFPFSFLLRYLHYQLPAVHRIKVVRKVNKMANKVVQHFYVNHYHEKDFTWTKYRGSRRTWILLTCICWNILLFYLRVRKLNVKSCRFVCVWELCVFDKSPSLDVKNFNFYRAIYCIIFLSVY